MFQCGSIRDTVKCYCNSHYPYSSDGEGRQADRQDDPGSHWAGSELALSQAWGERGAASWSGDTTDGIRWGVGGGVGSLTQRETHRGGHERKRGGMAQLFSSTGPCNQQQPERRECKVWLNICDVSYAGWMSLKIKHVLHLGLSGFDIQSRLQRPRSNKDQQPHIFC